MSCAVVWASRSSFKLSNKVFKIVKITSSSRSRYRRRQVSAPCSVRGWQRNRRRCRRLPSIPSVPGIRRIATLHRENMHVFTRKEFLQDPDAASRPGPPLTLSDLKQTTDGETLSVWLGPAMSTVLLSLEPQARSRLLGSAFETATIESETYACQAEGAPAIQTLATRAVLVTTDDVRADIGAITRRILEGEAFMGVAGGVDAMAKDAPSIPLHADAAEYYREAGFLPSRPTLAQTLFDWLSVTWRSLAVLVMLAAVSKGIIEFKREHASDKLYQRALASFARPPYTRDGQTLLATPRRNQRTRGATMVEARRVGPFTMA